MFGLTPFNRRNNNLAGRNEMMDLRNVFENFFNDSFFPSALSSSFNSSAFIRADIKETEKEYVIEAEIPGARKEDIKLELRDDVLTIGVEHNEEVKEDRENYIRRERKYGSFSRSFYVENVRQEDVAAKYENGILTVNLPKADGGKENKRRIEIN